MVTKLYLQKVLRNISSLEKQKEATKLTQPSRLLKISHEKTGTASESSSHKSHGYMVKKKRKVFKRHNGNLCLVDFFASSGQLLSHIFL